jgi:hypothetical protein
MIFPVADMVFKIGTQGVGSVDADMVVVSDMETLTISVDNGIEEWTPLGNKGWKNRLITAKGLTITLNGKRHFGDKGNDYVAGLAFANGDSAKTRVKIEFPNGDFMEMNCIVSVTTPSGGESTAVNTLEFECLSVGIPTYNEAGI